LARNYSQAEIQDLPLRLAAVESKLAATEQALERSEKLAVAGRFAAVVIHEINNPLEAVSNLVYLLKIHGMSEVAMPYLDLMEEQLLRISSVTHQALNFNRTALRPQRADLAELVRIAVRTYAPGIVAKRLQMVLDLPASASAEVYPGEITQAISNLVANAIDASEPGGKIQVRLRPKVLPMSGPKPGRYHITVSDGGGGVPEAMRATLFNAFATGKENGNGLGLWVCSRIVAKHGGTIRWRTSTREGNHGTTFRISLQSSCCDV